jgi:hypothetical protein
VSLAKLARLLGVPQYQVEDALHSENAARAVLSRRNFFAASGAMAIGSAFSFAKPLAELSPFMRAMLDIQAEAMTRSAGLLAWAHGLPFAIAIGETESCFKERARRELYRLTAEILYR